MPLKVTRMLMGMPITVEIADADATAHDTLRVFAYFAYIDETFSIYKSTSEITRINRGELKKSDWSHDMKMIFELSEETKKSADGYFDIMTPSGTYDPSGIVKGWAIYNATKILEISGSKNFYIEAGGDIETRGRNSEGNLWSIGVKNPFKQNEIVKVIYASDRGVATSGTYIRGRHIWNPKENNFLISEIISLTVIGPNIYEADRFTTAAFAMGRKGIAFIEGLTGFEGYMIDKDGVATITSGFEKYTITND